MAQQCLVRSQHAPGHAVPLQASLAFRYMRLASAVYGFPLLLGIGCWDGPLPPLVAHPRELDRQTVALHGGVPAGDVLHVEDMRGDSSEHPRWALVVDHATRAVVLAIRGTASLSDGLVHDLMAENAPYALPGRPPT